MSAGARPIVSSSPQAHILEEGIREELRRCLPTDDLHQQYRDELWEAVSRAQRPETLKETAIRRLESQLDRASRLFQLGEYDEATFALKRSPIRQEQERLKAETATSAGQRDLEWCRAQLFDLVGAGTRPTEPSGPACWRGYSNTSRHEPTHQAECMSWRCPGPAGARSSSGFCLWSGRRDSRPQVAKPGSSSPIGLRQAPDGPRLAGGPARGTRGLTVPNRRCDVSSRVQWCP